MKVFLRFLGDNPKKRNESGFISPYFRFVSVLFFFIFRGILNQPPPPFPLLTGKFKKMIKTSHSSSFLGKKTNGFTQRTLRGLS